jgi:AGCS family alanine or glycine:cation symporter
MIVKYSEVFLGVRHRVPDGKGGFRGGPMYFLQRVFKTKWVPKFACLLLCVYGVEIYQFSVVTETISANFDINKYLVATLLMVLIISMSRRGVHYIGSIASVSIPVFIVCYLGMGAWVLYQNFEMLPSILKSVFASAFSGHAAVGGFAGSTILLTASQGIRRSCYAGDIAVGYASVIHSESGEVSAEKQASLAIMEIFLDSFVICTTSVMIVLAAGVWSEPIEASMLVQQALSNYFPAMHVFMPIFLLMLGFTTIISYFCAGIKCAEFIAPRFGRKAYYLYALCVTLIFVNLPPMQALTTLSITAGILLMLNLYGIFKLRNEIEFITSRDSANVNTDTTPPSDEPVGQPALDQPILLNASEGG